MYNFDFIFPIPALSSVVKPSSIMYENVDVTKTISNQRGNKHGNIKLKVQYYEVKLAYRTMVAFIAIRYIPQLNFIICVFF